MEHRERVLLATSLRDPDRPPLDLGGPSWSIADASPYGYRKLCEHLGLIDEHYELKMRSRIVSRVAEPVLKQLDIDFRYVGMSEPFRMLENGVVEDAFKVKWRPIGDHYFPMDDRAPLAKAKTAGDIEEFDGWPDPKDPIFLRGWGEARRLREKTDYAVGLDAGPAKQVFHRYQWMRGFNQWFWDMRFNPELYRALADKIFEFGSALLTEYFPRVADYIDVVVISDDLGAQTGPLISEEHFKTFVKPWLKRRIKFLRRMIPRDVKILLHCCGSVYNFIPHFVECGVNILNPIQPTAKDMEPERLKKGFGGRICFHGGIDQLKVLPHAQPGEVRRHVTTVLDLSLIHI